MTEPVRPVRFKYLLGEWHLGSWRPKVQPLRAPPHRAGPAWPEPEDVPAAALDPSADGYWCREADVARFPIGVSRWAGWCCYVPRLEKLYAVDIAGGFDAYLARWSSKTRYNLRRSVKKLQADNGAGLLEIAERPEQMDAFLREAAAISRTTYQSRLLQSGLDYDQGLVRRMQALAGRGQARGYLLRHGGRAIAFAWCSAEGERLTYDVIGYLEDHAALSPGTVLLYLIVEDLYRIGRFKVLDFGVGEAPYKQMFSTRVADFADAYLLRPSWRHRLLVRAHRGLDRFSSGVGRALDRLGVKSKVRRWLRGWRA